MYGVSRIQTISIMRPTRAQPGMRMLRSESGIALRPVFHPGVECREQLKPTGPVLGSAPTYCRKERNLVPFLEDLVQGSVSSVDKNHFCLFRRKAEFLQDSVHRGALLDLESPVFRLIAAQCGVGLNGYQHSGEPWKIVPFRIVGGILDHGWMYCFAGRGLPETIQSLFFRRHESACSACFRNSSDQLSFSTHRTPGQLRRHIRKKDIIVHHLAEP